MASSPSPFSNTNKFQVLPPAQTTLLFTQQGNNNLTINNIANPMQYIRQTSTPNGTFIQQQSLSSGMLATPSSVVRFNQPISTQNTLTSQTVWSNSATQQLSPKPQYSPTIKNEPSMPTGLQHQSSILPSKLVAQQVVRQTVTASQQQQQQQQQQVAKFTEAQINDFVAKCRTFLTTLLKLAEKQAPEKLPMVRSCIQDLLDGTIDPESFTQRLHTLYKSQPHTSLVPFFKLALPHMRQIVKNTFGRPITIELLERLNLPSSKSGNAITTTTMSTATPPSSRVVVNPSLLTQPSSSLGQQPLLYTTVQPQQKINLLQQTSQPSLIGSTASLLSQQQQQQQQARAQISITGLRPFVGTISPSTNTNLLNDQQHHIQPITQTILQQSDSLPQRTFLSSAVTAPQQTQLITVNHQPILNNLSSLQQPQIQIQPRIIVKNEDDSSDDMHGNTGLLTASSGTVDDRHTRHITHDDRLLPAVVLRRRFDRLVKKTPRSEGSNLHVHDDSVCALISHATEERLKCLIQQIKSLAQQRMKFSLQNQSTADESNEMQQDLVTDRGVKRKLDDSSDQSSMLFTGNKRSKSAKRQYQANLLDLVGIMETDKHLKRSTLRYKALDRSS